MGGWTKTKLMLFSTQVEVVVELKLELSLAIMEISGQLWTTGWVELGDKGMMVTIFG